MADTAGVFLRESQKTFGRRNVLRKLIGLRSRGVQNTCTAADIRVDAVYDRPHTTHVQTAKHYLLSLTRAPRRFGLGGPAQLSRGFFCGVRET